MDGFLNILKPKGLTSHDVVSQVRRVFKTKKIGHLGTLDPMARGVLPVAVGSYRRLTEYLVDEDKDYLVEMVFGIVTDTDDLDGQVVSQTPPSNLTRESIEELLTGFTGEIKQVPPAFSAVQIDGKRLHKLARQGIIVDAPARDVTVHQLNLLSLSKDNYPKGLFSAKVGRGTYIRSLARDLGAALGCGASVSYLLRMRVGGFLLKEAMLLQSVSKGISGSRGTDVFADPSMVLQRFPSFTIRTDSLESVRHGIQLKPEDFAEQAALIDYLKGLDCHVGGSAPVFMGMYSNLMSRRLEIACALTADKESESSYTIKYEKVLI